MFFLKGPQKRPRISVRQRIFQKYWHIISVLRLVSETPPQVDILKASAKWLKRHQNGKNGTVFGFLVKASRVLMQDMTKQAGIVDQTQNYNST